MPDQHIWWIEISQRVCTLNQAAPSEQASLQQVTGLVGAFGHRVRAHQTWPELLTLLLVSSVTSKILFSFCELSFLFCKIQSLH